MTQVLEKKVIVRDLGSIEYSEALEEQKRVFNTAVDLKLKNRDLEESERVIPENQLLYCEHAHVYTLGRSGDKNNLLINQAQLSNKQASYFETGRGGDITYHGPGQVVAYPIFDLDQFFTDIHKYLRYLEEAVILTLADYGLNAGRIEGLTGVWLDYDKQINPRKICAFGVKASRWVTMHGLALNVNTDLSYFGNIVPCGIQDKAVTSLSAELGEVVNMDDVKTALTHHMAELFEFSSVSK